MFPNPPNSKRCKTAVGSYESNRLYKEKKGDGELRLSLHIAQKSSAQDLPWWVIVYATKTRGVGGGFFVPYT